MIILRFVFVCFFAFTLNGRSQDNPESVDGTWEGVIEVAAREIPVVIEIESLGNDRYKGTLLSPQYSQTKIPLSRITLRDRDIDFFVESLQAGFIGKVSVRSGKMRGTWSHPLGEIPLELNFSKGPFQMDRPQNPGANPPYIERKITIPNPAGDNVLSGTLTIPGRPVRPVPAVILLSDSGPHDRDASAFGHKPFLVLADQLTRKGIAVLRYDERGIGKSSGLNHFATPMDFAIDATAALRVLKEQKDVDPERIGIIGHGEGATHAAIVAAKRADVSFLILLAAHGGTGAEMILSKSESLGKAASLPESFLTLNQQFSEALFGVLTGDNPDLERAGKLAKDFEKEAENLSGIDPAKLLSLGQLIKMQIEGAESPWLHNFLKLDAGQWLQQVKVPVLSLNAANDLEVPVSVHVPRIQEHLKTAGNEKSSVETIKDLNHLFQTSETGLPEEYDTIDETIAPTVVRKITAWILESLR